MWTNAFSAFTVGHEKSTSDFGTKRLENQEKVRQKAEKRTEKKKAKVSVFRVPQV